MSKRFLTLIVGIILSLFALNAEPMCHIRHYSTEDGLPQYNIMDMLQDHKGYLWLATWDGLSKFDGYNFKNYKAKSADHYFLRSNRIEKLYEDKYGRIWFRSYDGDTHCFDPSNEEFWGIQSIDNTLNTKISNIEIKPSGKIWLIIENNGCMLLKDSLFKPEPFNIKNNKLKSEKVNSVLEEKNLNTWLLTNNGIVSVSKDNQIKNFFSERITSRKENYQSFFKGIELKDEIWFGSQNGRIWRLNKMSGKAVLLQLPIQSNIVDFIKISESEVCIFSKNAGFAIFNTADNKVKVFNTQNFPAFSSDEIKPVYIDKAKNLWFETNAIGINRFNLKTYDFKSYKVATIDMMTFVSPPVTLVIEDMNGRLWIQPKGGGFSLYNRATDSLEPFFNSPTAENWRFSSTIYSAFSDKQGNLWLSTHSHGLEKIVFDNSYFTATSISSNKFPKTSNEVRAVFEDDDLNLWISTKDRKLTVFDKNKRKMGEFGADGNIRPSNSLPAIAYCITKDKDKNIWIGTKGAGIFILKKTSNPLKFNVEHYSHNAADIYSLSDNSVYSIFEDKRSRIWIGTYGGGLNLVNKADDGKLKFINHRNHLKNYPVEVASQVRYVTQSNEGNICLGTTSGMLMFSSSFSSPESITFKRYTMEPDSKDCITNNDVHGICITKKGEMFLFTFGGGIDKVVKFDKQGFPVAFKSYTRSNGLPSDVTLAMVEDEFGKLWISTENSLTKFDPELEVFKTFSEIRKLMISSNFSEVSTCRLKNNDIIFGYSDGYLSFSPRKIVKSNFKPYIALTNFQLFNKDVTVGSKSPLTTIIDDITKLKLTNKQKFFNIEYAALDYLDPENILYAYKLDGFDNNWNYVQKQRVAYYTNIPKGKYIFRVKSTNSDGDWVENERILPIEVLPSFWQTGFARLLYVLVIAGLFYLLIRILLSFYHLKANVELEKKMSEMKLRFFTDISHEIRTPLTMITGPVDYMLNDSKTPEDIKHQLNVVSQNSNRLLRLVNQILDLRKIQFQNLKVQEVELADLVSKICDNFSEIAENQQIQFNYQDYSRNATVWVDPDATEKIVMNLLSNAFKYTPAGKSINVIVKEDDKNVTLDIIDEGVGISKEKQKKLFTRFVTFSDDKIKPSTGIGLNMVKELADKHMAKVSLDSDEGKGSKFTVSFQKGLSHFGKDVEIIAASNETLKSTPDKIENIQTPDTDNLQIEKNEKQSILIVEDDNDLRSFIRTILEDEYQVFEAEDGQIGMKMAQKHCPDFIVSDIMMPNMDGVELLQALRREKTTCHIPVVLLTAKTTIETKLEGLQYGADDYITKPFSVSYFRARIANLLLQRKNLQRIYRENLVPADIAQSDNRQAETRKDYQPQTVVIASHDDEMMKKIMELIEKNMDNSDFSVEKMGQYVGMSRSVFFKKLKSLTGLSPVEFVRDIKMKRAAQLLESGKLMVKEVATHVGISDTRYFAKCFKAKYGMIPQEYKSRATEKRTENE